VVEDLWNQFTVALRTYQEATEERKKAFEDLKARDEKSAREIDMQMRKLQRLQVFTYVVFACVNQLVYYLYVDVQSGPKISHCTTVK